MTQLAFIAAGGATGALMRYWLSNGIYALLGRGFPYGTLTVNVVGSLFMGFIYVFMIERMDVSVEWRAGLMIGLLGAFTTFSTFSIETLNLLESGEQLKAAMNILLSVTLCILGCWLGMVVGRNV
ncbi:MAG: fluoride efflux transporter CrcB [Proteobacteria bacterium]|nr:fluoride efflux transporter CrcB [Pseudomonadota bacterium]MCH8263102.1 fluoride efflux transporter CrcB [Pseudomonadota bacterium]MCH8977187.1 fluoride efflux transporter CrcB [Pseudomonadota bacterium]